MPAESGELLFQRAQQQARVDGAAVIGIAVTQIADDRKMVVGQVQPVFPRQFDRPALGSGVQFAQMPPHGGIGVFLRHQLVDVQHDHLL